MIESNAVLVQGSLTARQGLGVEHALKAHPNAHAGSMRSISKIAEERNTISRRIYIDTKQPFMRAFFWGGCVKAKSRGSVPSTHPRQGPKFGRPGRSLRRGSSLCTTAALRAIERKGRGWSTCLSLGTIFNLQGYVGPILVNLQGYVVPLFWWKKGTPAIFLLGRVL